MEAKGTAPRFWCHVKVGDRFVLNGIRCIRTGEYSILHLGFGPHQLLQQFVGLELMADIPAEMQVEVLMAHCA